MKPQPRLRSYRRRPLVQLYETPDDPWSDAAVVAWAIVVLLAIVFMSSIVPLAPVAKP